MIHLWMLLWRSRKSMPQYGLSVWVKWTVCFSSVGHTCQLPGGVWKCLGQQVCVPGQAQYFSYSRAWYKLSVFLHDLHVKAENHTTPHHSNKEGNQGESPHLTPSVESLSKQGWEGSLPFLLSRSHNAELLWCRWPPGGRQRPDTGTTCGSPTVYHVEILKTAAAISLLIREFDFSIVCSFQWRWKSLPFWRGLTMWRETVTKVKS